MIVALAFLCVGFFIGLKATNYELSFFRFIFSLPAGECQPVFAPEPNILPACLSRNTPPPTGNNLAYVNPQRHRFSSA